MKAYGNLNDLLAENSKAKKLFLSLPEHAQGHLIQRAASIHSFEALQSYVNGLYDGE